MSIIALKWAYSQPISSPVAKNILAFLASHNFPSNKMFFAIETICKATAYSRRAVIDAIKWLVENNYIKKEVRLSKEKGQQTNIYILNIPDEYMEQFCADYNKLSTSPVQEAHSPHATGASPPVHEAHPNNKYINNKVNKRSVSSKETKQTAKFWVSGNPDYDRVNGIG